MTRDALASVLPRPIERRAEVGVFGGSGFYQFLDRVEPLEVETPYGPPSGPPALGEVSGVRVAFLPRHGPDHSLPPHAINYRANVWAMASLGVERILSPSAAGSLQPHVRPGDFVLCDQFVDRTSGRASTFFDGPLVVHVATADPYCPDLRQQAAQAGRTLGISLRERGTAVVVQGPRFSTRAESRWFSSLGWEVVNMTQYPEVVLARELQMCYLNISLITDWDVGLEGHPDVRPVRVDEVLQVLQANNARVRELIFALLPALAAERQCPCASALSGAVVG